MKKGKFAKGIETELKLGNNGLKVSLGFLLTMIFFSIILLYVQHNVLSKILIIILNPLSSVNDYLIIFAGSILFVIVPFLIGIRRGIFAGKRKMHKKGIAVEGLVWWIIGVAVLVIMIVLAVVLKDKLWEIGIYIKNLFRFGR